MLTPEEQNKVVSELQEDRRKKIETLFFEEIAEYLNDDLALFDTSYIEKRVLELWETEISNKLSYDFKELKDEFKIALATLVMEAVKNIPEPALQAFFIEEERKKSETIEGHNRDINANDPTVQRNTRCEPHCVRLLQKLITHEHFGSHPEYLDLVIEEKVEDILQAIFAGWSTAFFSQMEHSVTESKRLVDEIKYDGRRIDQVSFKQLQNVLDKK